MKRKDRHLDGKPEKDSGEAQPRQFSRQQPGFSETSERGKIERSIHEVNPEEREQHRDAAEKCVNEKFGRGAVPILTAPDFDEQKCWNEAHLVK